MLNEINVYLHTLGFRATTGACFAIQMGRNDER